MKKAINTILLLIIVLVCVNNAHAQRRSPMLNQTYDWAPYHWGFHVGVNFMDYSLGMLDGYQTVIRDGDGDHFPNNSTPVSDLQRDSYRILSVESRRITRNPGFSVGFVGDLRLSEHFNFRAIPTFSINWKRVFYDVVLYDVNHQPLMFKNDSIFTIQSVDNLACYLEFPVHIKYRAKRDNNFGAYIFAGVNPKLYLVNKNNQASDGIPVYLAPKRGDFAIEFGSGFDFYNQWFKMGVEIKMSLGVINLLKGDENTKDFIFEAPLESLRSKQLQVVLTIE